MVIIVGAGPAGLALARRLQQRNVAYRILEKGQIGASWRAHYPSLRLHTLKALSHLPGLPYPDSVAEFPSRADFLAHLEQYTRHFALNVSEGVSVQRAEWQPASAAWRLTTDTHETIATPLLVAATGIWSTPYMPTLAGADDFGGPIVHANAYQTPAAWLGRRVLVVGAGNTAADIASELANAGVTTGIVVRSGTQFVPYPKSAQLMRLTAWLGRHVPAPLANAVLQPLRPDFSAIGLPHSPEPPVEAYPVVGFKLPQAVRAGKVTVHRAGIERLTAGRVAFDDGSDATYDALIMATGYRPTLDFLAPPPGRPPYVQFDARGHVCHDAQFRSTAHARLFLVGYDYPATSGWIQNIRRVSHIAADAIAAEYRLTRA